MAKSKSKRGSQAESSEKRPVEIPAENHEEPTQSPRKKRKFSDESRTKDQAADIGREITSGEHVTDSELPKETLPAAPKQSKRRRKTKSAANKPSSSEQAELQAEGGGQIDDGNNNVDGDTEPKGKPARFIVFIGNLPYTATTESVSKHFAKIQPSSVRHLTDKQTGKSKGYAFLEFEGYDRMKTCLKLYHHSTFDDGLSPARKVNVELTAGGGGRKSKDRKWKLRTKNEKLNEQRKRQQEEEAKQNRAKKYSRQEKPEGDVVSENHGGIHPSRLAMVSGS